MGQTGVFDLRGGRPRIGVEFESKLLRRGFTDVKSTVLKRIDIVVRFIEVDFRAGRALTHRVLYVEADEIGLYLPWDRCEGDDAGLHYVG